MGTDLLLRATREKGEKKKHLHNSCSSGSDVQFRMEFTAHLKKTSICDRFIATLVFDAVNKSQVERVTIKGKRSVSAIYYK